MAGVCYCIVITFELYRVDLLLNYSDFHNTPGEQQRHAEVEFVLTPDRQHVGDGFIDTLVLEFSDRIKSNPARTKLATGHLRLTEYAKFRGELFYLPACKLGDVEPAFQFFKRDEEGLYATDRNQVARVIRDLFSKVDGVLDYPLSFCFDVSVDGLDYFNHVKVKRSGHLYSVEQEVVAPQPSFYHTIDEETHGIRRWLESI
jgi:hypothetical protein